MKQKIILLLALIYFQQAFAQERRIIFQIDTLELASDMFFNIDVRYGNDPTTNSFAVSPFILKRKKTKSISVPITLNSDSDRIEIPIDNRDGLLTIYNAYSIKKDTLKINYHKTYINCDTDTTNTTTYYYYLDSIGKIDKPFKITPKTSIKRKKQKNCVPSSFLYKINGINYSIENKRIQSISIVKFHGYKPIKSEEELESYKGKITYFHGNTSQIEYINTLKVILKNNP